MERSAPSGALLYLRLSEQCPAERYSFLLPPSRRFVRLAYLYTLCVVFDVFHERRIDAASLFITMP